MVYLTYYHPILALILKHVFGSHYTCMQANRIARCGQLPALPPLLLPSQQDPPAGRRGAHPMRHKRR